MKLQVGDRVVYGNHGVGRIAARTKQVVLGEKREVVVIELDELTVTLPIERAEEQLRPPVTTKELELVRAALLEDGPLSSGNWLTRRPEAIKKLAAGSPVALAEIVSESAQRERARRAQGGKAQLAPGEHELFGKARSLLAGEIALALEIEPEAAEAWIDGYLERSA